MFNIHNGICRSNLMPRIPEVRRNMFKNTRQGSLQLFKLPSRQKLFSEVILNDSHLYSITWRDSTTSKAYFQYLPAVKYVYKKESFYNSFQQLKPMTLQPRVWACGRRFQTVSKNEYQCNNFVILYYNVGALYITFKSTQLKIHIRWITVYFILCTKTEVIDTTLSPIITMFIQ